MRDPPPKKLKSYQISIYQTYDTYINNTAQAITHKAEIWNSNKKNTRFVYIITDKRQIRGKVLVLYDDKRGLGRLTRCKLEYKP